MNPIGEPDAGNPHVRFDERGAETESMATAPLLDSTRAKCQPVIARSLRRSNLALVNVIRRRMRLLRRHVKTRASSQ